MCKEQDAAILFVKIKLLYEYNIKMLIVKADNDIIISQISFVSVTECNSLAMQSDI